MSQERSKRSMVGYRPGRITLIPVIFSSMVFSGCCITGGTSPEEVSYQEPKAETCRADPGNIYHILAPADLDPILELPLVIALDAHGDGRMAVDRFQGAVRHFPCLVAGSDLVKNNFQGFEGAMMQMITDIGQKYPVDKHQVILSGFSGGARMAYYFSLHHPLKGILMCGAGPGDEQPACPVYMISGMGDFNFAEMYAHPDMRAFRDDRFISDYFHGVHEWPRTGQLADALLFLLDGYREADRARRTRSRELLEAADSLEQAGDAIMAWKALEKAAGLSVNRGIEKQAFIRGQALLEDPGFREAIRTLESDLARESMLQQTYAGNVFTQDTSWWKNELDRLKQELDDHHGNLQEDHYQRIMGTIGILFYSAVSRTIRSDPGNPQLDIMLRAYAMAEPENPDPYYFMALHDLYTDDRVSCIGNLERSLQLGLTDRERIRKEFPENIWKDLN